MYNLSVMTMESVKTLVFKKEQQLLTSWHQPTQRAFVPAVQTDDGEDDDGDEDGGRQDQEEPGGRHGSSEEDRRGR